MKWQTITESIFDLSEYRLGFPQRSGVLTILPIFGPEVEQGFTLPLTELRLSRVQGYGNVELFNSSQEDVAIVPLHMGYIQDGAQNHALCRSAFIPPNKTLMMKDACCVQQTQGGYLKGKEQWFFILPLELREKALELRGEASFGKLWKDISNLNERFQLPRRGHLEQIISRERAYLNQYQSRFELLSGQVGAFFFLRDKLVGLEIAPSHRYFRELWMPLVCFGYGVAAMWEERFNQGNELGDLVPYSVRNLDELEEQLQHERKKVQEQWMKKLSQTDWNQGKVEVEDTYRNLRLNTVIGNDFAGQFVEEVESIGRMVRSKKKKRLVYASCFAKGLL
jgi:hypothetical protein